MTGLMGDNRNHFGLDSQLPVATENRDVFDSERQQINTRRKAVGLSPSVDEDLVGLALSGGGVRSGAISLGLLQTLDRRGATASRRLSLHSFRRRLCRRLFVERCNRQPGSRQSQASWRRKWQARRSAVRRATAAADYTRRPGPRAVADDGLYPRWSILAAYVVLHQPLCNWAVPDLGGRAKRTLGVGRDCRVGFQGAR